MPSIVIIILPQPIMIYTYPQMCELYFVCYEGNEYARLTTTWIEIPCPACV